MKVIRFRPRALLILTILGISIALLIFINYSSISDAVSDVKPRDLWRQKNNEPFLTDLARMQKNGLLQDPNAPDLLVNEHSKMKPTPEPTVQSLGFAPYLGERAPHMQDLQNVYNPNVFPPRPMAISSGFSLRHRIVHLDLKGAPPRMSFIQQFFQFISRFNATGVLIEWENTFPFKGDLAVLRSKDAYTEEDVLQIQRWAKEFRLEIIPLVQTVGHLEWILEHPTFRNLREVDHYPQVICLSNPRAVELVKTAIDQVMSLQADVINYFHIGADEAFQLGECQRCQNTMSRLKLDPSRLMLRHIKIIAEHIKDRHGKKVLMWHDMLQNIDSSVMRSYNLGQLVEPVVWSYAESLDEYLSPDVWNHFSSVFPFIWGASAFKGADGANRYHSNVIHYLQNHVSWIMQINREHSRFEEFRGIFLTGWQRFDHFAVLCELLVVGMPSLAINLLTLQRGFYDSRIITEISRLLSCKSPFDVAGGVNECQFPGSGIYFHVQNFHAIEIRLNDELYNDHSRRGWMGRMNAYYNYSSPYYLYQLMERARPFVTALKENSDNLEASLPDVYFPDTVAEFMFEYVDPVVNRLFDMVNTAQRIINTFEFPSNLPTIVRAKAPYPIL